MLPARNIRLIYSVSCIKYQLGWIMEPESDSEKWPHNWQTGTGRSTTV